MFSMFVASMGVITILRSMRITTTLSSLPRRADILQKQKQHYDHTQYKDLSSASTEYHWKLDDKLRVRYSSTHHNIPQKVSFMFDGASINRGPASMPRHIITSRSTTKDHVAAVPPDFQHKGIVKLGRENKKKWLRFKATPSTARYKITERHSGRVEDDRLVVDDHDPAMFLVWRSSSVEIHNSGNNDAFTNNNQHHRNSLNELDAAATRPTNSLCELLSLMTIRKSLDEDKTDERGLLPAFLNMTVDCTNLMTTTASTDVPTHQEQHQEEEGRLVASLYLARMIAAKARVDFQFMCDVPPKTTMAASAATTGDRNDIQQEHLFHQLHERHVFGWFGGYQSSPTPQNLWPFGGDTKVPPNEAQICQAPVNLETIPFDRMAHSIRYDVRRMVVSLAGSDPKTGRTHPLVPLDALPLSSGSLQYDDMLIYMPPCKDYTVSSSSSPSWSSTETWMTQFKYYFEQHITNNKDSIQSIGVVHSDDEEERIGFDKVAKRQNEKRCTNLANDLRKYLRTMIPKALVVDRKNETMPNLYCRLVITKYLFIPSNNLFVLFAAIGSFGEVFVMPHQSSGTVAAKDAGWLGNVSSMEAFQNFHTWTRSDNTKLRT